MLSLTAETTALVQAPAPVVAAPEIPASIKAVLDAATANGSDAEVAAVIKYAQAAAPHSAAAIDRYIADRKAQRRAAEQARLAQRSFFQKLKGHIELGGYVDAGATHDSGYTGAVSLSYVAGDWTQKLRLLANYQHSLGVTTRNNHLVLYEPNYRLSSRAFLYGAVKYEDDRFMGYADRYTLSAGFGYSPIRRPNMALDIEAGPAWRYTNFIDGTTQSQLSGHGNASFRTKLLPSLTFLENASIYLEGGDSTLNSKTALQARLIGPLSAQFSYTVRFESAPPSELRLDRVNTTSRASLALDF